MLDLNYEQGLKKLREIVQHQAPELLSAFSILEICLIDWLTKERRYGWSPGNNVEQNQVIDQLISFANDHFSILFIDLCRSGMGSGQREYDTNTSHYQSKYTIKNDGLMQGQVVGDHANITMHFKALVNYLLIPSKNGVLEQK
jgi:hypothetical protein